MCALRLDETQPPCRPAVVVVAAQVVAQANGRDGDDQGRSIAHNLPDINAQTGYQPNGTLIPFAGTALSWQMRNGAVPAEQMGPCMPDFRQARHR